MTELEIMAEHMSYIQTQLKELKELLYAQNIALNAHIANPKNTHNYGLKVED